MNKSIDMRHFRHDIDTLCGMSGGRTSAMLFLLHVAAGGSGRLGGLFANTGKEHEETLIFVDKVSRHSVEMGGPPVIWLEFTRPEPGAPPVEAGYRIVTFETANRTGGPFEDMLLTLESYRRKVKNLGPVVPGAKQRICTSYLKVKTMQKWATEHGFGPDSYKSLGIRHDEPDRAAPLLAQRDRRSADAEVILPMWSAGISGPDVAEWWASQRYQLNLPVYLGNCTFCHLKSEARLARAMAEHEDPWWSEMGARFGHFRRDRRTYDEIKAEIPVRFDIASELNGAPRTERVMNMNPRRRTLITAQERKFMAGDDPYSCSCAVVMAGDHEDLA